MAINHLWVPECFSFRLLFCVRFYFGNFKPGFDSSDRIVSSVILALLGTIAEAVSPKGLDNITIPAI